jgi:hypothetical protein
MAQDEEEERWKCNPALPLHGDSLLVCDGGFGMRRAAGPSVGEVWCDAVMRSRSCLVDPRFNGLMGFTVRWCSAEGNK